MMASTLQRYSVQRLKPAHRSRRSLLVVRFFKDQGQPDYALKVDGLSCFHMDHLLIFVDRKGHIIMADDVLSRQHPHAIIGAISDQQIWPMIHIKFHAGREERPWTIDNDRTQTGSAVWSSADWAGRDDRPHRDDGG